MADLKDDIPALCACVIEYAAALCPTRGLALAWVVCVRRDEGRYAELSRDSYLTSGGQNDEAVFADLAGRGRGGLDDLTTLTLRDPCLLLRFAAYLCSNPMSLDQDGELVVVQRDTRYSRNMSEVNLSEKERRLFALESQDLQLFVVESNRNRELAPVEKQLVHCYFHTPGWVILNRVIERGKNREFLVRPCPLPLGMAARQWSQRTSGILNVYIGEMLQAPEFIEPEATRGGRQWIAEGLSNDFTEEIVDHLKRAKEHNCDVVIFPELCVPNVMVEVISEWLVDNNDPDIRGHQIAFVVAGSFHKLTTDYFNEATVLDANGLAMNEMAHRKMTWVDFSSKGLVEGNKLGNIVTAVPTAIGLQSVVICLDLAQRAVENKVPLERLPISWYWVPSLSRQVTPHKSRIDEIRLREHCTVICSNQGPAMFRPGMPSGFAAGGSFVYASGRKEPLLASKAGVFGHWGVFDVPLAEPITVST